MPRDSRLRFEQLSPLLAALPPDALAALAQWFRFQAKLAREREARQRDLARMRREAAQRVERARRSFPVAPKAARDLEVMRLANRGWSNAMIGRKVGLHPVTVSRIVSRMIEREAPRYVPQPRPPRPELD